MQDKAQWRRRLDATLTQLSYQMKVDLYDNVVVPVVQDWFSSSDSIASLNTNIGRRLDEAWPLVQRKVQAAFIDFEESLKANLRSNAGIGSSAEIQIAEAEAEISSTIANVIGAIVSVIGGTLLGGAETALLLEGPIGWIIGAILAGVVFLVGKDKVTEVLQSTLRDKRIPALLKKPAKSKIATQLKLNEPKFEQELYDTLKEQAAPLYGAINDIME